MSRNRWIVHCVALALAALGQVPGSDASAAAITTARAGGQCTEIPASGPTPKTYQMAGGQTCQITFSVVLTGGNDVASALRADVSLSDPADAFVPSVMFGGPSWGTPESSFDGETFSVSVLSENQPGTRPFAVVTLQSDPSRQGILSIVLDDLILGRDINDPPFIVDVPFTPAIGSTLALVVVPEPGTLALLALGLAALAARRLG